MIPTEIQKLFNFIEYLDGRKAEFMRYIPLCDEFIKLNAERFRLNPQSNYRDKFRENEIEAEIREKIQPITNYIQNPIRDKLIELEIWSGSFADFSLWNKYYGAISNFKNDFGREDVEQVLKYKKMYLDFRTETNTDFVILHSIFRAFDQILKELFDFFKDTENDEFKVFENKINVTSLKEALEYALSSGKPASFTIPNEAILPQKNQSKLEDRVNIYNISNNIDKFSLKNRIDAKGDNNTIISGVSRSKIDIGNNKPMPKKGAGFWTIASVIIALITLFVALIVDWDKVLRFFK